MSLLRALTNLGVQPSDATTIDNNYANQNESDFLDGLEIVAKSIALKQLQTIIPVGEPWAAIYQKMLANGNPELGFFDSLACFDAALQISLSQVILTRCTEITQYQNKLNQSTGKRKKSGDYLKILHHLGYKFRFNMCTQSIEVNNQRINDEIAQQIRKQVRDAGAWEVNAVEDVYTRLFERFEIRRRRPYQ
jgi:hypothetical protein